MFQKSYNNLWKLEKRKKLPSLNIRNIEINSMVCINFHSKETRSVVVLFVFFKDIFLKVSFIF